MPGPKSKVDQHAGTQPSLHQLGRPQIANPKLLSHIIQDYNNAAHLESPIDQSLAEATSNAAVPQLVRGIPGSVGGEAVSSLPSLNLLTIHLKHPGGCTQCVACKQQAWQQVYRYNQGPQQEDSRHTICRGQ
jgi:hypothetical protein